MGSNQKKKKKNKACCCESRLKPHLPILQLLSMPKYSSKLKNKVLKHCSNDCILKICEIAYNLLKGNVPLKSSQKKKLAPQKHILRRLVQPQSVQKRRRTLLLNQKGGVFPVIPLILSLLSRNHES